MAIELKIPSAGESITEVQIGAWRKRVGDPVAADEVVVEIETEKAMMELPAPVAGVLSEIRKEKGESAKVGDVIAIIDETRAVAAPAPATSASRGAPVPAESPAAATAPEERPVQPPSLMPAARRVLAEAGVDPAGVKGSGRGGRVLKEDAAAAVASAPPAASATAAGGAATTAPRRGERVVAMSLIRRRIAERLVRAKQDTALLTTFNEIDMSAVTALRKQHQEAFQAQHQVKLGFLSFFVKAVVDALTRFPELNAEVRGDSIVYRDHHDIGIAVGAGRGLVVPVLRDADGLGFAHIERAIADFAARARDNRLTVEELTGGTFTISNGGVYGSLLSTPIVNPPQSGILGLHRIQERPVAVAGEVVIRPMMYVALTYDHRIVDGREAVSFLVRVKEAVEEPARLLIGA